MQTPTFRAIHGDCVEEVANLPTDSIAFPIFSPPFAALYVYSDNLCTFSIPCKRISKGSKERAIGSRTLYGLTGNEKQRWVYRS